MLKFLVNLKVVPLREVLRGGDAVTRQIRQSQFDGLSPLLVRRFGNYCLHRLLRFLAQNASGRSGVIAIDLSTLRVATGNRNAG